MIERLGLLYAPPGKGWACSHAQNPFLQPLGRDRYRVHFACRDEHNRSRGGAIEIVFDPHPRCVGPLVGPTIDLGSLGAFDDSGAMPSCIVECEDKLHMYYTGWTRAQTVPFAFHIGLAVSHDCGRTFERYSKAPVLGRNIHDPYMTGAPWVLLEDGCFRMWYVSCLEWVEGSQSDGKATHKYTVKYAESDDGISWQTSNHLCLPFIDDEYAIARPVVTKDGDCYSMLYSCRGGDRAYHVGAAVSGDGVRWERLPNQYLIVSEEGWDSEMVCYACPILHRDTRYLLYNGNGYGRAGFGVAVVEG